MKTIAIDEKVIAISNLRRRFGEIEEALPYVDRFILTKKGKPFAILTATPSTKREIMKKTAGALKGTTFVGDKIWKDILKRKSRKEDIRL